MSGNPKFFLGTDSAPHPRGRQRERVRVRGRLFRARGVALLRLRVRKEGELEKLEGFASFHGADFYGVARNAGTTTLRKAPWTVPETYEFGGDVVVPFFAGETVDWEVVGA